jgi:hypothetical protein
MRQFFLHKSTTNLGRSYGHSKLHGSNKQSHNSTSPQQRNDDTDSRKDLIFSSGNIRMQKDVYVELSDREAHREGLPRNDVLPYLSSGKVPEMV